MKAGNVPESTYTAAAVLNKVQKGITNMTEKELISAIKQMRELVRLADEAQAEADAIKDTIKQQMGDAEELKAGEYKITWKKIVSNRLDSAALKKALPDVYERYCSVSVSRPFKVS